MDSNAKGSTVLFMPEIPRSQGFVLKMASVAMHCSKQISAHQHNAVEDTTQAEQAAQLMGRLSCCCNGPRMLFGGLFQIKGVRLSSQEV